MPTECSAERFGFGLVEGRTVEAAFDGGLVKKTSPNFRFRLACAGFAGQIICPALQI
jgi:hypothetical protein